MEYIKERKSEIEGRNKALRRVQNRKQEILNTIEEKKFGNKRIVRESPSIEGLLGSADGESNVAKTDNSVGRKRRSGV